MKPACHVAFALLVASFGAAGCGRADVSQQGGQSPAPPAPQAIDVTRVAARTLNSTVSLPAEIAPYESVELYARETGFVKSVSVDRGSMVKRGQVLAEIEAPELVAQRAQANAAYQGAQSQLASAQAKASADRATFERMREAAKTPGVLAGNDVDIAQHAADAGEANVAAIEKTVEAAQEGLRAVAQLESYLKITAPFDGQVTARYVHPGALVGPSGGPGATTPMLRVQSVGRERVIVPVPENDIAAVPQGTMVTFTVAAFPGRSWSAPISRISRAVDARTRTMPVELDVKDPDGDLAPGSFCAVEWPVRRSYATLFVPASSVASNLQRTFVIRVRGSRTEWVDVRTGARVGNSVEVFGDLHEGDVVAVRGTDQIRAATDVQVKEVAPAT